MASAFVLMPLSKEFDSVYSDLIRPVLEGAGFDVRRADDILSTQNILQDIFASIAASDLVVADLTGSNVNVFYELAVSHACGKPVISLTQSVGSVPFDLRSYRLIEYGMRFAEISKAKQTLADYIEEFQKGTLPTSDPVSDFFPGGHLLVSAREIASQTELAALDGMPDADPPGFFDSVVDTENCINQMVETLEHIRSSLDDVKSDAINVTKDIERISVNPNQSLARAAQNVCRRFSNKIGAFNDVLQSSNAKLTKNISEVQESVDAVLVFQGEHIESTVHPVIEQRVALQGLVDHETDTLDALKGLISSFESVPRVERRLNKQIQTATNELNKMADNFSRLFMWGVTTVSRMDAMLERRKHREPE